ncbi:MAG: thiamine-phosphate kinase [Acidobacteriota bacterium]|nr:thiamine-phosphate kinase [Acidobacteriota bacterium]
MAKRNRGAIQTGIGDDSAVLRVPPGHEALITTDLSLEGVHFRRECHPPASVGHRCLTRGLSDIAAMGGGPIAAFLSLALPKRLAQSWVNEFLGGFLALANRFQVTLAGGDTAESPAGILADIVVFGSAPKGKSILRSGARAGDLIYMTGTLGASAAALDLLSSGRQRVRPTDFPAHFYPEPRLIVGQSLRGKASAMIDVSDGLSTDLAHICEESGVGAEVEESAIVRGRVSGKTSSSVGVEFALHGGEDYELLFTAPARTLIPARISGVQVKRIGRIIRGKHLFLTDSSGQRRKLEPKGWEHFRN